MPQNYYTYSNTFIDGQTAKATEVRDEFEAVQSGLDAFYDDTNTPMVVAAVAAQAAAEYAQALAETARTGAETAETNAQTAEANANTVLADVNQSALVSANHYGDWTALTGALNKPAAVSHNNAQWILKNNLADVMLSEPGVSADWGEIGGIGEHYQEFLVSGTWTKAHWGQVGGCMWKRLAAGLADKIILLLTSVSAVAAGHLFLRYSGQMMSALPKRSR